MMQTYHTWIDLPEDWRAFIEAIQENAAIGTIDLANYRVEIEFQAMDDYDLANEVRDLQDRLESEFAYKNSITRPDPKV